jgi:hypothetical protein
MRCGDTWNWKKEHVTPFSQREVFMCQTALCIEERSIFVLCEECWQLLTTDQRWLYYERRILLSQVEWPSPENKHDLLLICEAVKQGK